MRTALLLVAFASAAFHASAGQPTIRVEAVSALAASQGPRAALEAFFSCDAPGQAAYSRVESGAKPWVEVAVKLLPEADACYTVSLHDALARALVWHPENVLPLVNTTALLSAGSLCIPFFPAEEPRRHTLAYLQKEEAVLRRVHEPALQLARQACLVEIRRTRASLGA